MTVSHRADPERGENPDIDHLIGRLADWNALTTGERRTLVRVLDVLLDDDEADEE